MLQEQSRTGCVGLGQSRAAGAALGMDLETSRFLLLLFHTQIVEVFSPDLFCSIMFGKMYRICGRCFEVSSYSPHSQHCSTRQVSASIYNKNLLILVQPMILLLLSCCDKGSSRRWPFELGREEAEKPVRKRMNQVLLVEEGQVPRAPRLKPHRRQQIPGPSWACLEAGNFLSPLSTCHISEVNHGSLQQQTHSQFLFLFLLNFTALQTCY